MLTAFYYWSRPVRIWKWRQRNCKFQLCVTSFLLTRESLFLKFVREILPSKFRRSPSLVLLYLLIFLNMWNFVENTCEKFRTLWKMNLTLLLHLCTYFYEEIANSKFWMTKCSHCQVEYCSITLRWLTLSYHNRTF